MGGGNHPHDPNTSDAPQPAGVLLFPHADVEPTVPGTTTYEQLGWTATGDLVGEKVPTGAIGGQQPVSGFLGNGLINTFTNGSDQAQGTLTSPQFTISQPYINFLIIAEFEIGTASEFGLKVRTGPGEETLIGYDVPAGELFVDRDQVGPSGLQQSVSKPGSRSVSREEGSRGAAHLRRLVFGRGLRR